MFGSASAFMKESASLHTVPPMTERREHDIVQAKKETKPSSLSSKAATWLGTVRNDHDRIRAQDMSGDVAC